MSGILSIILIENQIPLATAVSQAISQHVPYYRLYVSKNLIEIITAPKRADVILLNLMLLANDAPGQLASLAAVYPGVPVILLVEPLTSGNGSGEWLLLQALSAGASDYATLSGAGLLTLGRRLAGLQHQTQQSQEENLALYQIASILTTTQDAQTIISTVLEGYLRALDLRQGSAVMFDFEAKCGVIKVSFRDNHLALNSPEAGDRNPGGLEDSIFR
jgi:hypothetical protein